MKGFFIMSMSHLPQGPFKTKKDAKRAADYLGIEHFWIVKVV